MRRLVYTSSPSVVFDGRDMTYAPPNEVAERGVIVVPGGQGVFPTLTVAEYNSRSVRGRVLSIACRPS